MKTIVNVYKTTGLWRHPTARPGIGDFLRGAAFVAKVASESEVPFDTKFNLDLTPAAGCFSLGRAYHWAEAADLAMAEEYSGDRHRLEHDISSFLYSDRDVMLLCTNQSWNGVDEHPGAQAMRVAAQIFNFAPEFERRIDRVVSTLPSDFALLHIRDVDRSDERGPFISIDEVRFRHRLQSLLARAVRQPHSKVACISNNSRLRSHICRKFGFQEVATDVGNPGFAGVLSEGELIDAALIRNASSVVSVSYYPWNSGFALWASRAFNKPAQFFNKAHLKDRSLEPALA